MFAYEVRNLLDCMFLKTIKLTSNQMFFSAVFDYLIRWNKLSLFYGFCQQYRTNLFFCGGWINFDCGDWFDFLYWEGDGNAGSMIKLIGQKSLPKIIGLVFHCFIDWKCMYNRFEVVWIRRVQERGASHNDSVTLAYLSRLKRKTQLKKVFMNIFNDTRNEKTWPSLFMKEN